MSVEPSKPASAATTEGSAAAHGAGLPERDSLAQQIVDSIQEGVVVYDRDLRYRVWNPFLERITGQPASEALGRHVSEVRGFVKEHGLEALLERALDGHGSVLPDTAFSQRRTPWTGHIGGVVSPLRNARGEIVGVLGIIHDITRRKRTEDAHLAYQQHYRQLFDDNPQPMWVHDVETLAFLAVNEAALRHYGYTREEFLFLTMDAVLAPVELTPPLRDGADLRGSVDEARVWRHRTKDGRILDVEINSHVITFAGRRAVLVVANDVTERLKAQQSLRENELKYRTLIEAADVAIFLSDAATGQILEANRRAETLLGLARHKIVGLQLTELAPPELAGARRLAPSRTGLPVSSTGGPAYVWHRAGRRIPVDIISSAIEVGGRKLVQSIYRDITERRRAEEALARRTQQLEVLARANRQIHAVLEVPVILRALVKAARELIQATGGLAGLVRDGKVVFEEYQMQSQTLKVSHQFEPGQGVAGYVFSSKLTYCTNEPEQDPLVIPPMQRAYKLSNLVCVPILDRQNQVLGCLELHNTENHRSIEATDLTMIEVLAASAALAIENARLLAQHAALLESVPDGVLVVDEQGQIVGFNENFASMWGIPGPVLDVGRDEAAMSYVLQQLKNPEAFASRVRELYATPEASSQDRLEFKDGRVWERFSRPRRVAGRVAGRVWSFREITGKCGSP
jgi:PAS domain S-box-containing protein